jgi:hypothetical protein
MSHRIATDDRIQKGMAKGIALARSGELQRQAEILRQERPQTLRPVGCSVEEAAMPGNSGASGTERSGSGGLVTSASRV